MAPPVTRRDPAIPDPELADLCRRSGREDVEEHPGEQFDAELHRRTIDELIRVAHATYEPRFGAIAARKLASLPGPERDLMVLAASGRYPCRLRALLLRESQAVLAARIRAGVVHLRDAPPSGPVRP